MRTPEAISAARVEERLYIRKVRVFDIYESELRKVNTLRTGGADLRF